jgi:cytoskeletal protein CcmA (bactofilin family)
LLDIKNKEKMKGPTMENVDTIIGNNVKIKGSLKNSGSIQVNGSVDGEIQSDQMVTIGETATVSGPIRAKVIEISGSVKGIVHGEEKIELNPKGQVHGDINTKCLIIKQGAIFNGKSQMTDQPIEHPQNGDKKEEK